MTRHYACKNIPRIIELKLTTIGNPLGVVLPKEALAHPASRLKLAAGGLTEDELAAWIEAHSAP